MFDTSSSLHADAGDARRAHEDFLLLRSGGFRGGVFEPSLTTLADLDDVARSFVLRGTDVLKHRLLERSGDDLGVQSSRHAAR